MTNYIVCTRKAAEQGFPEAQYRLASALASREVVQKDMMAARQWTERAARQGHAWACFTLGAMLANGDGGERN